MPIFRINNSFHPVGQGLFSSGFIETSKSHYTWVYDCGTSSSRQLLQDAIDNLFSNLKKSLKTTAKGRPIIDMVIISHFDADHVNGLEKLLKKFKVRRLVLPYMPLFRRLIIAFDQDLSFKNKQLLFFINPASYLTNIRKGYDIDEIVFVEGGGDIDHSDVPEDGFEPIFLDEITELDHSEIKNIEPQDNRVRKGRVSKTEFDLLKSKSSQNVKFLSPDQLIHINDVWEFIPYNEFTTSAGCYKNFRIEVNKRIKTILNGNSAQILSAIEELKQKYSEEYKNFKDRNNMISLFMYSGARERLLSNYQIIEHFQNAPPCHFTYSIKKHPIGTLYTGDGYLNTPSRLSSLNKKINLSKGRRQHPVLQVMHHGSHKCWFKGIAAKISPFFSVFSSNPKRKKNKSGGGYSHPDAEVVRDFLPFTPVQVDTDSGFYIDQSHP